MLLLKFRSDNNNVKHVVKYVAPSRKKLMASFVSFYLSHPGTLH